MLTALRSARLITVTRVRDSDWQSENEHRSEFMRFLREIPQDFRVIARDGQKREIVKTHLKNFYMRLPQEHEVETVLERITNLASLMEGGRAAVEDKAAQSQFKCQQWQTRKRCEICGHVFSGLQEVTLDHIVPLSLGGSEKASNWQLTCTLCNAQKQEYWGVSDISRLASMRACATNDNFFKLTPPAVIAQLKSKARETQLYVAPREAGFLLTIDNLTTYCVDCTKKYKVEDCK
jgi:5-methylcytosine-specific restriction endonuclease McrA